MTTKGHLILITGVTGFVGFRVLREALQHGYHVRAAVRSEAKAELVRSNKALEAMKENQLEFVIVPDFLADDAFDEAVKGVKYIIHVASPVATKGSDDLDPQATMIQPAVRGTLSLLSSAQKHPSIQRIAITSSSVSITPPSAWTTTNAVRFTPEDRIPDLEPPFPTRLVTYLASKIAACNAAEAWIKEQTPTFDLIHIHPTLVFGRDDVCESIEAIQEGTNRFVLNIALGIPDPQGFETMVSAFCSVHDVARVHVMALDEGKVKGNQSFFVSSKGDDGTVWNDVNGIVRKRFPTEVKSGVLPCTGTVGTMVNRYDVSKTEETFGFVHAGLEECVVEVVEQYLELLEKEKGSIK